MGYDTSYSLATADPDNDITDILSQISDVEFSELFYALDRYGGTAGAIKWYEHEDDVRKLSLIFPDILFKLYGAGEYREDIWYKYFLNGKMQYCPAKVIFNDYDPAKLY